MARSSNNVAYESYTFEQIIQLMRTSNLPFFKLYERVTGGENLVGSNQTPSAEQDTDVEVAINELTNLVELVSRGRNALFIITLKASSTSRDENTRKFQFRHFSNMPQSIFGNSSNENKSQDLNFDEFAKRIEDLYAKTYQEKLIAAEARFEAIIEDKLREIEYRQRIKALEERERLLATRELELTKDQQEMQRELDEANTKFNSNVEVVKSAGLGMLETYGTPILMGLVNKFTGLNLSGALGNVDATVNQNETPSTQTDINAKPLPVKQHDVFNQYADFFRDAASKGCLEIQDLENIRNLARERHKSKAVKKTIDGV